MLAPTLREREETQYADLFGELISAFVQCDPGRVIYMPGFVAPAYDLFADELSAKNSDDLRSRALYILGWAATQTENEAMQIMATRFLLDIAHGQTEGRVGIV